ncbi:hypothetical protein HYH02_009387 [Chlamydomonas schloesseri]|uniref:Tubulin--tyrosine ligase-like protein 5 n=1 Tax=Chlamydomonas schloesseri TaxID=2026947 RepID=A0A835W9Z9_9CHLO|nr:hypothetical protein HYH02_009387 [Chlamydomonas schloesseri]|eukprot:KAG2443321.1 hypothetical protein HYH02_009387 [Chlamydomonas schloesseri]
MAWTLAGWQRGDSRHQAAEHAPSRGWAAGPSSAATQRARRRAHRDVLSVPRARGSGGGGGEDGGPEDGPGGGPQQRARQPAAAGKRRQFRFWIDYQAFSSAGSAELIERALVAVGGVRAGGPPKLDASTGAKRDDGVYGYMHMDSWDLLWSVTAKAALAADLLRPHQMLAIVPGLLAVSRKTTLIRSLRDMFGDAAWGIVPRSYKLPDELDEWGQWVADNPGADTGMWMLKNNKQRGTGLRLVRTSEAFTACFETVSRPDLPPGVRLYRWYLAQQYITRPMLIDGRKFGVRVWVLVSDVAPLRLYMHGRGLVLFSSHRYDAELVGGTDDGGSGGPAPGHVTNYAQNENGDVWSLVQLAAHVGAAAFSKLWADMCRAAAMAFAAALPRCAEVMEGVRPPAHSCFQFFGLDFLVDAAARPWLLEVNATPSMKVEHENPNVAALIGAQKWPAVRDMVALVGIAPQRFEEGGAGGRGAPDRSTPAYALEELRRRGGFVPLLHLLPHPAVSTTPEAAAGAGLLRPLPWGRADRVLRDWCKGSREYQAAAAEVPALGSEAALVAT